MELTGWQGLVFSLGYAWFLAQAKVALIVEQARREAPDGKLTAATLDAVLARSRLPPPPAGDPGQPAGPRIG